jgi:hypothetical protein
MVLDVAKSDFGRIPAPESVVHLIEHTGANIKITSTTTLRDEADDE